MSTLSGSCEEIGRGRLCLGDARELIKILPDSSVDAVVTDPPWGMDVDEYDDPNLIYELEPELWRVLKSDAWLVFYYSPKNILNLTKFRMFRYVWMIPYVFWSFSTVSRNPLGGQSAYSIIVVMAKGKPKISVPRKDVIISDEIPVVEGTIREPLFKPTYTTLELITMFTKPGDLVLDPFSGYGSIPLVCELFERRWIAFEIDRIKYEITKLIVRRRRVPNIASLRNKLKESVGKP